MSTNADYVLAAPSRPQAPTLPPLQSGDTGTEQYYPQSATVQLHSAFHDAKPQRTLPPQNPVQQAPMGRGPVPKFQKVKSIQELKPKVNAQPAFRRANPEGGFISVRP